jgi:hypothetical protein
MCTTANCLSRVSLKRQVVTKVLSQTSDLFRRTTAIFTAHPILWAPLVCADILRSMVQWFSRPVLRAALLASAPRSVLGGGIAGMPSQTKIALIAGGIGFAVTALGLLFYLYALGVVARSIDPDARTGLRKPLLDSGQPDGLWPAWLRICGLAALYLVCSGTLVSTVLIPRAARAGAKAASMQWLIAAVALPLVAVVLYFSIGTLRTYVLRVQAQPLTRRGETMPYFLMMIAAVVCGTLVSFAIAYLTRRSATPAIANSTAFLLLQVIASVITAFPYAYAMTGLSLSPVEPD